MHQMMISTILKREIETYADSLREGSALLAKAKAGVLSPASVGKYLASIHYLLKQTPVHLDIARERASELGANELARFFESKREEEVGHDAWAAADLEQLSKRFGDAIQDSQPADTMLELVAGTRETILRDPHSYLAYILFAEYFTVVLGPEWLSALHTNCGVPASATTCVSHHIDLDKEHVLEGCRELDALAGDERYYPSLTAMLRATMSRFSSFCSEVEAA